MIQHADFLTELGAEPDKGGKRRKGRTPRKEMPVFKAEQDTVDFTSSPVLSFLLSHMREVVVTLGVAALLGSATINAVFLQEVKHPAPLFAESGISHTTTAAIPKSREIVLVDPARLQPAADPVIAEIQRHLAARGYYDSEIDGILGARTRAAIGLYQRAFNETVTNEASVPLLEHIRLSSPDRNDHVKARQRVADNALKAGSDLPGRVSASGSDVLAEDAGRIKQVQQALAKLGYRLVADGVAGRNTRQAISDFKKQHGLESDDRITLSLINELIKLKQL